MSPDNKGLRIAVDREVTQTSTRVTPVSTRQPFQYPGSTRPSTDYGRDEDLPIEFTSEDFTFRHPSSGPPSRGRSPIRHGDATIGIALGSPRVLSPQAQAQREAVRPSPLASSQSVSVFEVPPDYWAEPGPRTKRVLKKQKSTPWKSVFGKGHPERAMTEPNYSTSVVALPNKEATSPPPLPSLQALPIRPPTAGHVKRESQTRGMTRQMIRAEMDRAAFEKALAYSNAAHPSPPESLQPGQGATTTQSQAAPVRQALLRTESAPVLPQAGVPSPLLNVEIPTAEMERYSVMFEKLQRQPQTILERRRGSLTKLRPVVEETSKVGALICGHFLAMYLLQAAKPRRRCQPSPSTEGYLPEHAQRNIPSTCGPHRSVSGACSQHAVLISRKCAAAHPEILYRTSQGPRWLWYTARADSPARPCIRLASLTDLERGLPSTNSRLGRVKKPSDR